MDDKKPMLRALFDKYREIIMYIIFGGVTTAVSWLVYSLCMSAMGGYNQYFAMTTSNVISWVIAVSVAFITNKIWVFGSLSFAPKLVFTEAATFFGGRVLTGVLETAAVPFLVGVGLNATLFGIAGLPAKILVSFVIIVLNYILSKFISFGAGKKGSN